MEDSKLIQCDKAIKTKAEKDRRIKEIQELNLKQFVEERKRLVIKHQRHEEQLRKGHAEQKEMLEKEATKVNCRIAKINTRLHDVSGYSLNTSPI